MAGSITLRRVSEAVLKALQTNNSWQRLLKYALAITAAVTLAALPPVVARFGKSTFFIPLQTIFAHPAQRVGPMIEAQILVLSGSIIGIAWGSLGLHLSSLVIETNVDAAYAIRAIFALVAVLVHGFLRSSTPRIFLNLFFMFMTSFMLLSGAATHLAASAITAIMYPILAANALLVFFGIIVYPEFSSRFLGVTTIDTLSETVNTLAKATNMFVTDESELGQAVTRELSKTDTKTTDATESQTPTGHKKLSVVGRAATILQNPVRNITGKNPEKKLDAEEDEPPLAFLTSAKAALRSNLNRCKGAQREVNFELSVSALPLDVLRPISTEGMKNLVQNTVSVIGACENKLLMLGIAGEDEEEEEQQSSVDEKSRPTTRQGDSEPEDIGTTSPGPSLRRTEARRAKSTPKQAFLKKIKLVKPSREMEAGDAELLAQILRRIRGPVKEFMIAIKHAVAFLISCLAYCYDVPKLPDGTRAPKGILLEEIDIRISAFMQALDIFDRESMDEFKQLVASKDESEEVEILPSFETFLVSSFLLGLRQAAINIHLMLQHVRLLVEARQARKDRSRIYLPNYFNFREWLSLGGEEDAMVIPRNARKPARSGAGGLDDKPPKFDPDEISIRTIRSASFRKRRDLESGQPNLTGAAAKKEKKVKWEKKPKPKQVISSHWFMRFRSRAADAMEWLQSSDDLEYAVKLSVAVALVSWPGFLADWHEWYTSIRGMWAPMQLILVFEVAIGTSIFVFFLRLFGVIFGCTMGLAAYEIGDGNVAVAIVILMLGVLPCIYIQLETKYVKAGMVAITTMMIVALSALNRSGSAVTNFIYRFVAFLIGGVVAMLVEVTLYPVRARDRLIESLSSTIRELTSMQGIIAIGIDDPVDLELHSPRLYTRFAASSAKAQAALTAAETFLPFCLSEPRLKGDFKALVPVYREIIYVLHQIIDRMDTVVSLRKNYGNSVLEDLNPLVYAYRRNVAGGIALSLFAVNEALTTRLPLPQFLPSNRIAQLRLINRVRELLSEKPSPYSRAASPSPSTSNSNSNSPDDSDSPNALSVIESVDTAEQISARHKLLAWNAATSGQVEVIEYLEELVELAKLIVGVNAFRSGILENPDFGAYMRSIRLEDLSAKGKARREHRRSGDRQEGPTTDDHGDKEEPHIGAGLRRAETFTAGFERWATTAGFERWATRRRESLLRREVSREAEGERMEQASVPMSLQRVGSRLRREGEARRKSIMGKGKGVERDTKGD